MGLKAELAKIDNSRVDINFLAYDGSIPLCQDVVSAVLSECVCIAEEVAVVLQTQSLVEKDDEI